MSDAFEKIPRLTRAGSERVDGHEKRVIENADAVEGTSTGKIARSAEQGARQRRASPSEQRIVVDIDEVGRIRASADGFDDDLWLQELERLLAGLAPGREQVDRNFTAARKRAAARVKIAAGKSR